MGYSFADLGAEGCCRSLNALLCILCILIQGTMVEQLCLNGFTLYKYICNKKNVNINDLCNFHYPGGQGRFTGLYKLVK